jgi:NAD(P)H dehydrogenase (quinone)
MFAVTGATGHLGEIVIAELLKRKVNPKEIVAIVRQKSKTSSLVAKGVEIREASYDEPIKLESALKGIQRLLLISGTDLGKRAQQHQNVIDAAKKNNVSFIAYTSLLNADKSKISLATEHLATEKAIRSSGLPFSILRNGWYFENYFTNIAATLEHGIAGSTKNKILSAAAREDYAAAAAEVLVNHSTQNKIYEFAGDSFTLTDMANEFSLVSKRKVAYHDMPAKDYENLLLKFGLPAPVASMLADSDLGIERGDLYNESRDLEKILGRKPMSMKEAVKRVLS